jgi:hypothetical protein
MTEEFTVRPPRGINKRVSTPLRESLRAIIFSNKVARSICMKRVEYVIEELISAMKNKGHSNAGAIHLVLFAGATMLTKTEVASTYSEALLKLAQIIDGAAATHSRELNSALVSETIKAFRNIEFDDDPLEETMRRVRGETTK